MDKHIGNGWDEILADEFQKEYFKKLEKFVDCEYDTAEVFPPEDKIFSAFAKIPPERVKAVILGQDPYHEKGQANGFAFAVNVGAPVPPSLRNIFKELTNEFGSCDIPSDLETWEKQGVLMLNTVLTVKEGQPKSHGKAGWQIFTDEVIKIISGFGRPVVFMLWGADAWKKEKIIDGDKNLIIKTAHPSPLSAYRGFFGSDQFIKANRFLGKNNIEAVNWHERM